MICAISRIPETVVEYISNDDVVASSPYEIETIKYYAVRQIVNHWAKSLRANRKTKNDIHLTL